MDSKDPAFGLKISGHQQSWGYEDGTMKGPGPPLLATSHFCYWPLIFNESA